MPSPIKATASASRAVALTPLLFRKQGQSSFTTWTSIIYHARQLIKITSVTSVVLLPSRSLAQVRPERASASELWFTASFPARVCISGADRERGLLQTTTESKIPGGGKRNDHKPPDERTLKLGKTLRRLSPLLPTILTQPLPNDILSPNITLHLFPSTHPHLPVVKGRVPYRAALWTAPVAWGSVPIVGNLKLNINSEKIVRTGLVSAPVLAEEEESDGLGEEKLVVRWTTEAKSGASNAAGARKTSAASMSSAAENNGTNRGLSVLLGGSQPLFKSSDEPFTGIFVFSFDKDGRVASMTIEHADENSNCDKTSRVVTLADWLLGKAKWSRLREDSDGGLVGGPVPGLAVARYYREGPLRRRPRDVTTR